ncbi:MAG: hypothetical protein K0S25_1445, partial [Bacillus sp. (in: firmicutes)]|nr:hypothetical protein [Bacillus sp. (in: firmicutes)]
QEQDEGTAYWYPFVPPTTDMMYLMPQISTNSSLYISGQEEQNAIITGSVRTNGGGCEKTGDPNTRYLGTEYGQELKLAPGGIYITAGRNNLVANFDDEEGVKLSSHKKLILEAEQEIIIESQKTVSISAASQILIATPSAAISMENETHFLAEQTHITCTDESPFPEVEQPEQEEEQQVNPAREKGEEKAGINWGKLAVKALATVAAVASYAAMQCLGPFSVPVVGALVGMAQAAIGDIWNEKLSDPKTYFDNVVKTALIFVVTDALFGPSILLATAVKAWGKLALLGGASGVFMSVLDDVLSNRDLDFKKMVEVGGLSAILTPGGAYLAPKILGAIKAPSELPEVVDGAGKASSTEKIVWPPNDGGILGTEKNIVLGKGYQFDRYGLNTGSYVAPVGTPYEMRSLAPGTELKPYKVFEVVKPVRGEGSVIAPWFGQPGGGIQIKLNNTIQELIDSGRIIEVEK